MPQATDALFQRLESALEQWAGDVASTHSHLSERLAAARARVGEAPSDDGEVQRVAMSLQTSNSNFTALRDAVREAFDAAKQALGRTAELERAFSLLAEDVQGLKTLSITTGSQASFEGMAPESSSVELDELRANLEEQRDRVARLEQHTANTETTGPSVQQWSRLERDFARLRGEVNRLRNSARAVDAPATAFGGAFEEIASPEVIDLDLTGFDNAGRRRRMGEILVEAGVLSESQVERALEIQQEQPQRRLGSVLIELGYTESDIIAQVLACQARVPFIRLERDEPDPSAVRLVSERLATHHVCIPLRTEDERIVLAMANPMDLIAIEDIEHATGLGVEPVAASSDSILRAVRAYYGVETR